MWPALLLVTVTITIASVDAGLLRVPKIYNTVITSDANLEPSRAYPIVQPVLTVQPVVAVEDNRHPYYPLPVQGLYPFLAGTNALYQQPLLYGQPPAAQQPPPPPPQQQQQLPQQQQQQPQQQPQQQQQIPPMPLGDMLNHHNKNPEIPDVPPPPLPVWKMTDGNTLVWLFLSYTTVLLVCGPMVLVLLTSLPHLPLVVLSRMCHIPFESV